MPDFLDYLYGIIGHRSLIAGCVVLMLALAVCWIIIAPVTYTSTSTMLVNNRGIQIYQQDIVIASLPVEAALVQNQIELLQSDKVLLSALDSLSAPPADETEYDRALRLLRFKKRLTVGRVGTSHAVSVSFTSPEAEYSAKSVNAVVQSYLRDQREANEQAAQATSAWLKDRVKGLGANARVISEARPAPLKDGPGRLSMLILAGILGVAIGIGISLVLTYLRLSSALRGKAPVLVTPQS